MKKITIFEMTFIMAVLISFITIFQSCQKDSPIDELNNTGHTENIGNSDIPLNDTKGIFLNEIQPRNGDKFEIFYLPSKSNDNKTIQGVQRKQTIYNAFKIDTIICVKQGNETFSIQHTDVNGNVVYVQFQVYEVTISYKDGSTDILGKRFVKKDTPLINIPTSESLLNIASLAKWVKITNNGGLSDYGDVTYGKNKKYYTYLVEINTGSLFSTKLAGSKNNSNVFEFKHQW